MAKDVFARLQTRSQRSKSVSSHLRIKAMKRDMTPCYAAGSKMKAITRDEKAAALSSQSLGCKLLQSASECISERDERQGSLEDAQHSIRVIIVQSIASLFAGRLCRLTVGDSRCLANRCWFSERFMIGRQAATDDWSPPRLILGMLNSQNFCQLGIH